MSISTEITRINSAKTAIATSIGNKGVTVPSTTKLDGYAALIDSIPTGGGSIPTEALTLTGSFTNRFAKNYWNWFIDNYGSQITTSGINGGLDCAFLSSSSLMEIPFIINGLATTEQSCSQTFYGCTALKSIGGMNNIQPNNLAYFFYGCSNLREIPTGYDTWNFSILHSYTYAHNNNMFQNCYSLRSIPKAFLQELYVIATIASYHFEQMFNACTSLNTIDGLFPTTTKLTSNIFTSTFNNCSRIKDMLFATDNGTPYSRTWSNQTIDLSQYVGYVTPSYSVFITDYNSGITKSTKITDATTYASLKDNVDSWTNDINYSRYNHTSAVNTINSLPNCSAGSGNVIKFKSGSGALTDGGAVSTLTEAEIAVATAKGWTVTLVA